MKEINKRIDELLSLPRPDRRGMSKIIKEIYQLGRFDERERIFNISKRHKKVAEKIKS